MKALLYLLIVAGVAVGQNAAPTVDAGPDQTAAGLSGRKVSLSWVKSVSVVDGYHVYRSRTQGQKGDRINSVPITGTTYVDAGLASGTYYYVATATLNGEESVVSNEAVAVIE